MDKLNDIEALTAAWRALAHEGSAEREGWRTIPLTSATSYRLLAGRHFPGNQEAVLVGFTGITSGSTKHLPEGKGFMVTALDLGIDLGNLTWFGLIRRIAGNLEIFTEMAADIIAALNSLEIENGGRMFDLFLQRIHAWQRFMQHGSDGGLSPQAEIGLHGELVLIETLLEVGMAANTVIDGWYGPLDGIQDFQLGVGAIEVKTTISSEEFIVIVTSLEQLDNTLVAPLFLVGVKLRLDEGEGFNLSNRVMKIKSLLQREPMALAEFENRLLYAGFHASLAGRYTRRFVHDKIEIFEVDGGFPNLTSGKVPKEITDARYEIDLGLVQAQSISLELTLRLLGVS